MTTKNRAKPRSARDMSGVPLARERLGTRRNSATRAAHVPQPPLAALPADGVTPTGRNARLAAMVPNRRRRRPLGGFLPLSLPPFMCACQALYVRLPGMGACQGHRQQDTRGARAAAPHAHASTAAPPSPRTSPRPGRGCPKQRGARVQPLLELLRFSTAGLGPFIPV